MATDSLIGWVVVEVLDPDPAPATGDSLIGFVTVDIPPPHHPIGVWNETTGEVEYVPILQWTGGTVV